VNSESRDQISARRPWRVPSSCWAFGAVSARRGEVCNCTLTIRDHIPPSHSSFHPHILSLVRSSYRRPVSFGNPVRVCHRIHRTFCLFDCLCSTLSGPPSFRSPSLRPLQIASIAILWLRHVVAFYVAPPPQDIHPFDLQPLNIPTASILGSKPRSRSHPPTPILRRNIARLPHLIRDHNPAERRRPPTISDSSR
jgi:hypothetical protein